MRFFDLFLFVTQSFALRLNVPSDFGGKTDFANKGWRDLIGDLSPELRIGQWPTKEASLDQEPTCASLIGSCSISYFGKDLTFSQPASAQLWVKWHEDSPPFACHTLNGCVVTSDTSVADLTSQSNGWKAVASINANNGAQNDISTASASLSFRYSDAPISPRSMRTTKTLTSNCFEDHMCYLHTGTLMMTVTGKCESKPVIVCNRRIFPCEEFELKDPRMCMQWDLFTWRHCNNGRKPNIEDCSLNIAVTDKTGIPMSFQVFEQKPLSLKRFIAKRDYHDPERPYSGHPDGSSGVWMVWDP